MTSQANSTEFFSAVSTESKRRPRPSVSEYGYEEEQRPQNIYDDDNNHAELINNNSNLVQEYDTGTSTRSCLALTKFWGRKKKSGSSKGPSMTTSVSTKQTGNHRQQLSLSSTSSPALEELRQKQEEQQNESEYNWAYFINHQRNLPTPLLVNNPVTKQEAAVKRSAPLSASASVTPSLVPGGGVTPFMRYSPTHGQDSNNEVVSWESSSLNFSISDSHSDRQTAVEDAPADENDTSNDLSHLLVPPQPQNRDPRLIAKAAAAAVVPPRGVYEGEMEPVGLRGQEAPVPRSFGGDDNTTSGVRIRTFGSNSQRDISNASSNASSANPGNSARLAIIAPSSTGTTDYQQLKDTSQQFSLSEYEEGNEQSVESGSVETNRFDTIPPRSSNIMHRNVSNGGPALQFAPSHRATSTARNTSTSTNNDFESTTSDDDLNYLVQQDFLLNKSSSSSIDQQNQRQLLQTQSSGPSAAAARAAATAAAQYADQSSSSFPPRLQQSSSLHISGKSTDGSQSMYSQDLNDVDELNRRAMEYVQKEQYDLALKDFEKVLHIFIMKHGKIHTLVASAYHNLGTVHARRASVMTDDSLHQQHCRQQALEAFQAAARCARDTLGSEHPNVAVSLVRVGFLLLQSRQYQNAIITFQEALRIRLAHFGAEHSLVANLYNNLGVCYMHLGEFLEGNRHLQTALNIQRKSIPRRIDSDTASTVQWLELADTLFNIGGLSLEWIRRKGPDTRRAHQAEEAFTEALEIRLKILGRDDPLVTQVKSLLDITRALPRPQSVSPKRVKSTEMSLSRGSRSLDSGDMSDKVQATTPLLPIESNNYNSSSVSTPETSSQQQSAIVTPPSIERNSDIFRSSPEVKQTRPSSTTFKDTARAPKPSLPIVEISVSKDEEDDNEALFGNTPTRVYVSPHPVPFVSPTKPHDATDDALPAVLGGEESFEPDISNEDEVYASNTSMLMRTNTYDAEENCLLSNSGIVSDYGKIHFPSTWDKPADDDDDHAQTASDKFGRDLLITQPYISPSPSQVMSSPRQVYSTGNKERDDVMARARAILMQHQGQVEEKDELYAPQDHPKSSVDMDAEEGLAPLGGVWPQKGDTVASVGKMLSNPMQYVAQMHKEGIKRMKANDFPDAISLFRVIVDCQKRRHGPLHADVGAALYNYGIVQLRANNYEESRKAFEEAARVRKGSLGRDHPQVATTLVKVGITLLLLHQFEEALWSFREALSVRRHALGELHPSLARVYNNLGCVHVELGQHQDARHAFEAALDIQRNALTIDPENGPLMFATATTLCNLGYSYRYRGLYSKAALVLKEAAGLQTVVLGGGHSTVLTTLDNCADSYAHTPQISEALKHYNLILDRFKSIDEPSTKTLRAEGILLYKMSIVHEQRNDLPSQADCLTQALKAVREYRALSNENTPDTLERRIQRDLKECREHLQQIDLKWV